MSEEVKISDLIHKDEFGNYIIEGFEDLGMNYKFDEMNELTSKINMIGKLSAKQEKELQAYKDRENKLREYIKIFIPYNHDHYNNKYYDATEDILQILNDKENIC